MDRADIHKKYRETDWTYEDIAREYGIDEEKFSYLMSERFDTEDNEKEGKSFHLDYTTQWAERIKTNTHQSLADNETVAVLKEAGYRVVTDY